MSYNVINSIVNLIRKKIPLRFIVNTKVILDHYSLAN